MAAEKYFRNRRHISDIEPDCLWQQDGRRLRLVDEDRYYSLCLDDYPDLFYEVPAPPLREQENQE